MIRTTYITAGGHFHKHPKVINHALNVHWENLHLLMQVQKQQCLCSHNKVSLVES